jgi:type II secretory pathway predicted ATPase ExeA
MYESFFGFSRRPFSAAPTAEFYFPGKAVEQARLTLTRCIERGTGPGLLVAPTGAGKSLLCHVLAKQFEGRFAVAMLAGARISSPRALLQAILFELGLPFRDMHEGELRLSLIDHVAPSRGGVSGMLLLVDEAHMLSPRLLEEIRMITNLVRDGELRVRVVLSGNGKLEERFASPKLESFNQRIAARCYLESLNHDETCRYVGAQVSAAGADADKIFVDESLTAIHRASDGIPRLINQLADHALMLAAAGGQPSISAAGIEEAWSDLQQLPAPFESQGGAGDSEQQGGEIEFGSLSDDEEPQSVSASWDSADDAEESHDPTQRLDEIERHVAAAQDDWPEAQPAPSLPADEQFDPADEVPPEVELSFHDADDPFAEPFAEEEVVGARILPFAAAARSADSFQPINSDSTGGLAQGSDGPDSFEVDFGPATESGAERRQTDDDLAGGDLAENEVPAVAASAAPPEITVREAKLSVVARQEGRKEMTDEVSEDDEAAEFASNELDQFGVVEFLGGGFGDAPLESTPDRQGPSRPAERSAAAGDDDEIAASDETSVATLPLLRHQATAKQPTPSDDRDIIVVDDEKTLDPAADAMPDREQRPRYRRLFAQLRQRQA